jgi:peptidoglycan hydrolase CwlO-like protein
MKTNFSINLKGILICLFICFHCIVDASDLKTSTPADTIKRLEKELQESKNKCAVLSEGVKYFKHNNRSEEFEKMKKKLQKDFADLNDQNAKLTKDFQETKDELETCKAELEKLHDPKNTIL